MKKNIYDACKKENPECTHYIYIKNTVYQHTSCTTLDSMAGNAEVTIDINIVQVKVFWGVRERGNLCNLKCHNNKIKDI